MLWGQCCLDGYTLEVRPSHEECQPPQGDPTKQRLYQGAEIMPDECKPEESLCTVKSGAQVAVAIPTDDEVFQNLAIVMIRSCAYSVLVESNLFKIVAEFSLIVINCNVADSIDCASFVPSPSEI